ncbi:ethylene-responsive transcription factor ERF024-like [Abrus precatorius]|uniref:Ethylene-responsive transcription factor ERF024-like n=1 Tax=Abrus precatorius TaxID=3816 RepID=A0A8B8L0S2_ABRPR|nr:ethylene-responsive transcription factor ERF024-like [Abrus precatorius]
MDFEYNECPNFTSQSSSSTFISHKLSAPPNPTPLWDSSNPQTSNNISSKRKAGRKKFKETRHPVYRGVRQRNGNKWVCEIREPNKKSRIWVGTYTTPEMAARAHDVAVLALRGTSAKFNFPDSAFLLPLPNSCSPSDIRAAAAKANATFSSSHNNSRVVDTEDPCLVEGNSHKSVLNISMQDVEGALHHDNDAFLDEEALYNMPGLLDSMAEGLIITPPSMTRAMDSEDNGCQIDLTLWTD